MTAPVPSSETVTLLGVRVSRLDFDSALKACTERAAASAGGYVCFANAHSLTEAKANSNVREALNDAYLAVADGVPLVWTSQLMGRSIGSRVCGPDFMKALLESHRSETHGFIGGSPGQAEEIARQFGVRAVCYSPPVRPFLGEHALEDWSRFLELCPGRQPPRWIWVGLGAPKQEMWMRAVSPLATGSMFFGVGAAYDFLTGTKRRAPVWMQKTGLEWLYRLSQEPGRLWKRYLVGNTKFIFYSLAEILK